jgi:hypothetical protein
LFNNLDERLFDMDQSVIKPPNLNMPVPPGQLEMMIYRSVRGDVFRMKINQF